LVKADLSWAHLEDADLRQAHLAGADLRHASLSGVKLHRTRLEGADLRGATGISNEELEAQAGGFFLDGTTMPNGQKYEEWDKSRGKDGENSGTS
jgi:uncharacterized protein YjbI with pentapeptide repeats